MSDNKVTIDAAYFNHLFTRAVERERLWSDREGLILENEKIAKERDELKRVVASMDRSGGEACGKLRERIGELEAKLSTEQNYEAVIAAKDREIEAVKEERNRINAKVNELIKGRDELKAKLAGECKNCVSQDEAKVLAESLAAAERCIEEIESIMSDGVIADCAEGTRVNNIIRDYREKKESK